MLQPIFCQNTFAIGSRWPCGARRDVNFQHAAHETAFGAGRTDSLRHCPHWHAGGGQSVSDSVHARRAHG